LITEKPCIVILLSSQAGAGVNVPIIHYTCVLLKMFP